jgi:hypothetical protein
LYPPAGSCTAGNSQVSFSNGVGMPSVTLYNVQSTTLTVTDVPTSKTGTSSSLTVGATSFDHFLVSPSTTTPTAGSPFTATLSAHDLYDNVATSYTGATAKTITWSALSTSPAPASTPPTYPTSSVVFTNGNSTSPTLSFTAFAAGANTLTATDASISKSGSASLTVSAAGASKFAVPTPTTQTAGSGFSEIVTAHDAYDNVASSYTGSKTLVWSGPNNAPGGNQPTYLPNPVTFTAGQSATVTVTLYRAETPTLTVGDGTITGSSTSFTVTASSAATVAVVSGSGQSATVNAAFASPLVAKVTDAYGNTVSGASVTFAAPSSGASASFAASGCTSNPQTYSCVATTNGSGQASSSVFTANSTGGTYNISAQATGTNTVTFSETNVPTVHISSLVTGATTGTTTWGASVTVTVRDNSGNLVNGVAVTGAWSPTSAATPSGCTTNASGVCTITSTATAFATGQLVESWTVSGLTLSGYTYGAASNVESSITASRQCAAATVCATNLGSSVFQTTLNTSSTAATLTGTVPSNSTALILIARDGKFSGDSVTGVTGTAIGTATQVNAITSNMSTNASAFTNLWIYRATGTGTASGTVTVNFNNLDNIGTLVQVVVMSGNNTTTPIAQSPTPTTCTTSCTAAATANLTSPSATSGEIVLTGQAKATGTATTSSTTGMTRMSWNQVSGGTGFNASTWSDVSAQATSNYTFGTTGAPWGTIAVEVSKSV